MKDKKITDNCGLGRTQKPLVFTKSGMLVSGAEILKAHLDANKEYNGPVVYGLPDEEWLNPDGTLIDDAEFKRAFGKK